jgi:NADH dehydrogenase (ubiquinone) 1 alpha subcomplex subunit 6
MRPTLSLAVTIPARLAKVSKVSASRADARSRALALYRDFYRSSPEICALYALDVPPSTLRAKYREKFEQAKGVEDLAVIDVMLHKGRVEFQETINAWKQIPHMMKLFAEEEVGRISAGEMLVVSLAID